MFFPLNILIGRFRARISLITSLLIAVESSLVKSGVILSETVAFTHLYTLRETRDSSPRMLQHIRDRCTEFEMLRLYEELHIKKFSRKWYWYFFLGGGHRKQELD